MVPAKHLPALFAWATSNQLALFPIHRGAKALGTARYTDGSSRTYPFAKPLEMASFDPVDWSRWYNDFGGCNFGVAVTQSGLIVVDIDIDDDGKTYAREWYDWLEAHQTPSHNTLAIHTPSGGIHLYYRTTEKNLRQPDLIPGKINIRANNGYVVSPWSELWSSVVGNGSIGNYEIYHDEPIMAAFPALVEHCRTREYQPTRTASSSSELAEDGLPRDHGKRWHAEQALRKALGTLQQAQEGTRNSTLNICAVQLGHWIAGDYIDEGRVIADLATVANAIGLTPEETASTIRSGLTAGKQSPIDLPRSALTELAAMPAPLLPYLGHEPLPSTASVEALASMLEGRPLVEKLAMVGRVSVLTGKYSTGKTTMIMSLAYADACGMRHFMPSSGFQAQNNPIFTQPAGWLVCSFERTEHLVMLGDAFERGHNTKIAHPERLQLIDMPQEPLVRTLNRSVAVNAVGWKSIADEAKALREKIRLPVVIVIDNTAAAIGNRSDEEQAKMFMAQSHVLARHAHAVIIIAHPTKSGSSTVAGSSMFYDLADCVGELESIDANASGWVQWINFAKYRGPDDGMGMVLRSSRLDAPVMELPNDWGCGNYSFFRRQQNALRLPFIASIEVLPKGQRPSPGVTEVPAGEAETIQVDTPVPYASGKFG